MCLINFFSVLPLAELGTHNLWTLFVCHWYYSWWILFMHTGYRRYILCFSGHFSNNIKVADLDLGPKVTKAGVGLFIISKCLFYCFTVLYTTLILSITLTYSTYVANLLTLTLWPPGDSGLLWDVSQTCLIAGVLQDQNQHLYFQ